MTEQAIRQEPEASVIYDRVNHLLDTTKMVDPREIAEKVMADLPDDEVYEAVEEMIVHYVGHIVSNRRHTAQRMASSESHQPFGSGEPAKYTGKAPALGSGKAKLHQSWTKKKLASPYAVPVAGSASHTWKILADLTAEDCAAIAEARFDLAARNEDEGTRFKALAKKVASSKAATVGKLPHVDTVIAEIFNPAT